MSVYEEIKDLETCERLDITTNDIQEIKNKESDSVMRLFVAFQLGYKRGMDAGECDFANKINEEMSRLERNTSLLLMVQDQITNSGCEFNKNFISNAVYEISLNMSEAIQGIYNKID